MPGTGVKEVKKPYQLPSGSSHSVLDLGKLLGSPVSVQKGGT